VNVQPQPYTRILFCTGNIIDTTYGEYERIKSEWNEFVIYGKDRIIDFTAAGDPCCVLASAIISITSSTAEGQIEMWDNEREWDAVRKEYLGFTDE
jgi:hypothetical protein